LKAEGNRDKIVKESMEQKVGKKNAMMIKYVP